MNDTGHGCHSLPDCDFDFCKYTIPRICIYDAFALRLSIRKAELLSPRTGGHRSRNCLCSIPERYVLQRCCSLPPVPCVCTAHRSRCRLSSTAFHNRAHSSGSIGSRVLLRSRKSTSQFAGQFKMHRRYKQPCMHVRGHLCAVRR